MEENKDVVQTDEELVEQDFVDDEEEAESDQVEETKSETKKTQTKEERSFYANLRRRNEELEKQNKKLIKEKSEADFSARKNVISADTLADLGLDKIEDENDLLLCEEYDKAVKRGSENPVLDATKAYRKRIKTEHDKLTKAQQEEANNKKLVQEDAVKFQKEYGISASEAMKDEKFTKAFGKQISYGNLTELYGIYLSLTGGDAVEEKQSKQMGKVPNSTTVKSKKVDINDLDGEEFLKAFNERYH